jgi:putative tricarboxylic transport membrane protein
MSNEMTRRNFLLTGGALAGGCALGFTGIGRAASASSGTSGWTPSRQIRIMDPFAAGGGSDVFARAVAKSMRGLKSNLDIVVINRPGANGAIGYTFFLSKEGQPNRLLASESAGGIVLPIVQNVPYSWKSFTPIAQLAEDSTMLVVPKNSPYKNLKDFIKGAKHGRVTFGTTGRYGTDTICFALLEEAKNVKIHQVVFNSGGEITTALLGGHIDAAGSNPSESIGQIKAGKIRPLAVFRKEGFKGGPLADVPTVAQAGVDVDVTPSLQYRGDLGTGGITDAQRKYWEKLHVAVSKTDTFKKYIKTNYLEPKLRVGQEFSDFLQKQAEELKPILKRIQKETKKAS